VSSPACSRGEDIYTEIEALRPTVEQGGAQLLGLTY
jgi:hypothetical protein